MRDETPASRRSAELRKLPAVDRIIAALDVDGPHALIADAARRALERAREAVTGGAPAPTLDDVVDSARDIFDAGRRPSLRSVLNATGVLIHTNLGRVPVGFEQLDAVAKVAQGYSNLEYDIGAGRRGDRYSHAQDVITALTGAESALVVNNNAAAVLLVLSALCAGKEVVISRGELIEIGGEFRIPDVLAASGARLVEVGTTNRTRLADYDRAITPATAAILKVHPSNYKIVGFTSSVPARDLARLARGRGILLLHDIGSGLISGAFDDLPWAVNEPSVELALDDGADIVTFSGDKLLGGPQAGVILGRSELIDEIRAQPLLRALRVDKMTLAALVETFRAYLEGRASELPVWRMALASAEELGQRARSLARAVTAEIDAGTAKVEAVALEAVMGGGSFPETALSSWGISLTHAERTATSIERSLRAGEPPVVARIEDDRVLLDLRTVPAEDDALLASLVYAALSASG